MDDLTNNIYARYYELEFQFLIPHEYSLHLIDSKMCDQELCLLILISGQKRSSPKLSRKKIIKQKREDKAKRITQYSIFLLQDRVDMSHPDESRFGFKIVDSKDQFREECQKRKSDLTYTESFRIKTSFKELANGEYQNYSLLYKKRAS